MRIAFSVLLAVGSFSAFGCSNKSQLGGEPMGSYYKQTEKSVFSGTTIASVEEFLVRENITSLADFLPRLNDDYRAHFVILRESSSLQPTKDPLRPRAILYGKDAKLILAFNHSGTSIEMIEAQNDRFEFARLNFRPEGRPAKQTNCAGCHNGHPLWGQYRNWAGMYGGDQERIPDGSLEEKDYLSFLKFSQNHALYKNLIFKCGVYYNGGITPGFVERSLQNKGFPNCKEVSELVSGHQDHERVARRLYQPAEGLNELLNRNNANRLFTKIKKSAAYDGLKYVFVANALGCLGHRIYDYSPDSEGLIAMRRQLSQLVLPIEEKVNALARKAGSGQSAMQGQILNLLGVDLNSDLRLDFQTGNRSLGNDCDKNSAYSPNPDCRPGSYGYEAYSDGTDMSADLIAYLVLRNIFSDDENVRTRIRSGLDSIFTYFSSLPPGSGSGYTNVDYVLAYLKPVMKDLETPGLSPSELPKYIHDYPFAHVPRWGNGLRICQALVEKIELQ